VAGSFENKEALNMILDETLEFCDAVSAIQAASSVALIGDVVDLGAAGESQGSPDKPLFLVITVDTAVVSADSNPLSFKLVSDAQAALATNGTASEHVVTPALLPASYPAGAKFVFALPSPGVAYERYLGILEVTGAGTSGITAGKVNAFLTFDAGHQKAYPDAI